MKSLVVVLLATAASAFATAAAPFNYNGYYLATFTYPGGSFQHCIGLTETQQDTGYTYSGTWLATDFPDTAGTYAVYNGVFHLAGYTDNGTDFITIDGHVGANKLRSNATFDYFNSSGNYYATGSVSVVGDSCETASVGKPSNSRSFLK
jgi:hypothetical protein